MSATVSKCIDNTVLQCRILFCFCSSLFNFHFYRDSERAVAILEESPSVVLATEKHTNRTISVIRQGPNFVNKEYFIASVKTHTGITETGLYIETIWCLTMKLSGLKHNFTVKF